MWLYNPISKFYYSLRTENDVFSTLIQGTASYVFDLYLRFILEEDKRLIGSFHDEKILRIKGNEREKTEKLCKLAIQKVNDYLNLNRELSIGIQFAKKYSEVH